MLRNIRSKAMQVRQGQRKTKEKRTESQESAQNKIQEKVQNGHASSDQETRKTQE